MIASRILVVSEVVAELAFRMKLPGIHDVDVSALYPSAVMIGYDTDVLVLLLRHADIDAHRVYLKSEPK